MQMRLATQHDTTLYNMFVATRHAATCLCCGRTTCYGSSGMSWQNRHMLQQTMHQGTPIMHTRTHLAVKKLHNRSDYKAARFASKAETYIYIYIGARSDAVSI